MRIILQDKFTGANGTALASHAPNVGGPWTDDAAGLKLLNGKVTGTDPSGISTAALGCRICLFTIGFDLNGADPGSIFVIRLDRSGAGTGSVSIVLLGDGSLQFISTAKAGLDNGASVALAIEPTGAHVLQMFVTPAFVYLLVDGTPLVRVTRPILPGDSIDLLTLRLDVAAGTYPLLDDLLVLGAGSPE